ncbi:MAG: HEAT repeat domain-containing protein [Bryobacterales bacterium]|nr:HEAT repeat domain-containing protein [Bryobacterales bacterium]
MSCEWIRSVLSLFLYGELSFEDEERVHGHLETCESCRAALERERALHAALDGAALEPSPELLAQCRTRLRESLRRESAREGWLARLWAWSGRPVSPALLRPATALALVAAGFFGARLMPTSQPPAEPAAPVATQVRYLQPEPSGGVRIVLDETRERTLLGSPGEAPIQQLVLEAAQDPSDPGLRLDSLDILRPHSESPGVRQAFLRALRSDPNAGVRLKAIEGLRSYAADPEVRSALAVVLLSDDNVGVRTQAIDLLVENRSPAVVGILQQAIERERDTYIRERVQKALLEMNASMGAF